MKYTVIQKSGWQGSSWKVAKTFQSKSQAQEFRDIKSQPNARDDFYHVRIMTHRKPLARMMSETHGDTVKFSDGTLAVW